MHTHTHIRQIEYPNVDIKMLFELSFLACISSQQTVKNKNSFILNEVEISTFNYK